jgi:hypothetical protein
VTGVGLTLHFSIPALCSCNRRSTCEDEDSRELSSSCGREGTSKRLPPFFNRTTDTFVNLGTHEFDRNRQDVPLLDLIRWLVHSHAPRRSTMCSNFWVWLWNPSHRSVPPPVPSFNLCSRRHMTLSELGVLCRLLDATANAPDILRSPHETTSAAALKHAPRKVITNAIISPTSCLG